MNRKVIISLVILFFFNTLLINCENNQESIIPTIIPVFSIGDVASDKNPTVEGSYIVLTEVNSEEFLYLAICPILHGFTDNSEGLMIGDIYQVEILNDVLTIELSQEGNNVVYTGNLESGAGSVRVKVNEMQSTFGYVHKIAYDFNDEAAIYDDKTLSYNFIPEGSIINTDNYNYHCRSMAIMVIGDSETADPIGTSFVGGEVYWDSTFSGFTAYDIRLVPNPSAMVVINDISSFIQQVKNNYGSTPVWTLTNIDPDLSSDGLPSGYHVYYDNIENQIGFGIIYTEPYDNLNTISGTYHDYDDGGFDVFVGLKWNTLNGSTYSRGEFIDSLIE